MPTPEIDEETQRRYKRTIEAALRDGWNPIGQRLGGLGSSIQEAARRIQEEGHDGRAHDYICNSLRSWVRRQEEKKAAGQANLLPDWGLYQPPGRPAEHIGHQKVARWILTWAQDDTDIHAGFWTNLQSYANWIDAEILISPGTYQTVRHTDVETLTGTYRKELRPFLRTEPIDIGHITFAADVNILATATDPVSTFDAYGRGRTVVFGHPKHRLKSVSVLMQERPRQVLTTGAVTVDSKYIEKKQGKKARFHHIIGALIVEATRDNTFYRHISATSDGAFYDLDRRVANGSVTEGHTISALTLGDLHSPYIDPNIADMTWGRRADSIIECLRPKHVIVHDLLDMRPVNRHEANNKHFPAMMRARGEHVVEAHVKAGAKVLREIERDQMTVVVVESNHDRWLTNWVQQADARNDPHNGRYWHYLNLAAHIAIDEGDEDFNLVRWALQDADPRHLEGIDFYSEGGSFVVGSVEVAQHGHNGPNGARGSAKAFARTGMKVTFAHTHSPEIFEGAYVAGISCIREQPYVKGPSGWAHAHVVQYPNGKRTLLFLSPEGKWQP